VWASIFAEPTAGAEVTVNGEAGTIEVGGQVINTPAETKPAPTATPEPLLPPDFTVANWKEFRTKILPYCFVQPGLTDDIPGVDKVKEMLQGSEILEKLDERVGVNMFGYGTSVVSADGGGCAIISIWSDANTKSGALFQSKFDQTWIEITFVKN